MIINEHEILAIINQILKVPETAAGGRIAADRALPQDYRFTGGFAWHLLSHENSRITGLALETDQLNDFQLQIRRSLEFNWNSRDIDLQLPDLHEAHLHSLNARPTCSGWSVRVEGYRNPIEFFEAPERRTAPVCVLLHGECFPTLGPLSLLAHELVFKRVFFKLRTPWAHAVLARAHAVIQLFGYDTFLEHLAETARWYELRSPFLGSAAQRAEYWVVGWEVLWQLSMIYPDSDFQQLIH